MREEMRGLAQSIVASHEARATGFASIRRDVLAQREHTRRDVQELEGTRRAASRTLHGNLARGRANLKASVSAQVRELDQAHNAMARRQRQGLAKVRAGLNRAENRRKSGVHSWMEEVASTHQAMAQELRADLSKGHADLRASVSAQVQELDRAHQAMARQQREGLAKGHADLGASVSAQLQGLDRAHNAMARQQRETLAKVHSDLSLAERQRKSDVRTWLEEVAAAHSGAREEWQNLAGTMREKRAGVVVAEAPPAVAPAPPAAPVEVEEEVEVGEVTEELASLSTRVFAYLANHPDGTRLTELEREFGLGRFQASRAVKHLMNDGKAKKQGLLYFAT